MHMFTPLKFCGDLL